MLRYTETTVFNVGVQVIVNTVNCVGVMGNGLALECRLRYPSMFEDYVARCKREEVQIGKPYVYWEAPTIGVLNFPVKIHWRYPARLTWVAQSLQGFRQRFMQEQKISSIAFPLVGCHLGKLNPADVQPMMEHYLADLACDICICLDQETYATGIEGRMVALLNDGETCLHKGMRRQAVDAVVAARPIKRIRDVRQIAGIGKHGYERLHRRLYAQACDTAGEQGALFASEISKRGRL